MGYNKDLRNAEPQNHGREHMNTETSQERLWIAYGLIVLGVLSRLVPHPWNATPIMAIALFGGTYLAKRWAIVLPLATVVLSDVIIGWHETIPFTWGAFILTGMIAWWLRPRPTAARILTGSLTGSVLFFLITNFGVWAASTLYPRTAAGLWDCFVAAIPFFRSTVLGDLIFTTALFAAYGVLRSRTRAPALIRPQ